MLRYRAVLFLATAIWAATFPAYKAILAVWHPVQLQFWRYTLATVLIVLFGGVYRSPKPRTVIRRGILLGIFLWGAFTAQAYGIARTTASRAAFLTNLLILFGPGIYLIMARWTTRGAARFVRISRSAIVRYGGFWILAGCGLGLLTLRNWTWTWNAGDTLCTLGALLFAVQMVWIDYWDTRQHARLYAWLQMAVVAGLTLAWAWLLQIPLWPSPEWTSGEMYRWLAVLALALLPSWAAFEWQARAQPHVHTPIASLIYATEPFQAALLARVFLGERFTALQWLGGVCITVAILGVMSSGHAYAPPTIEPKQSESPG